MICRPSLCSPDSAPVAAFSPKRLTREQNALVGPRCRLLLHSLACILRVRDKQVQHIEARADIARRNPGGPDDGWVDEAWFLAEPMQGLSPGVEVGPEHRKACAHAIGLGPGGGAVDVNGLAEALPYPDGTLAFVVSNHVLEHCADPVAVLREWRRALCLGGLAVVVMPDSRYVDTFSLNPEHKHITTPEVLREWFAQAGGYEILKEAIPVPCWSCGVIARADAG